MQQQQIQGQEEAVAKSFGQPKVPAGPTLYEIEYLNQVVEELNAFLRSKNVTTIKDIYLGIQGGEYRGQMLISRGA